MRRTAPLALASLLSLLPLLALRAQESDEEWLARCRSDRWHDERARFCEVRELGFRPGTGTLEIDADQNGGIAIIGWERDSVAVSARIEVEARTDDRAREIAQATRVTASARGIRTDSPGIRDSGGAVSFVVYVPRRVSITADTYNGPVSARDVAGELVLRAHNGPIVLRGVGGDVRARTTNGPLNVVLDGDRWDGRGLDAETQNGPVTLTVPDGYSARLETGTINGPMRIGIPITVRGRIDRRITTELGTGGPTVRVITTNGPVVVRRG
jgi:hypothetical protein